MTPLAAEEGDLTCPAQRAVLAVWYERLSECEDGNRLLRPYQTWAWSECQPGSFSIIERDRLIPPG